MNKEVRLTVICICYNHEKYIRQTLESILNQKIDFRIRVLVHDDASTDSTPDIVSEFKKKYPDIVYPILQKNNQFSKIGIKKIFECYIQPLIEGEYVAFCEGDDYWNDENKLQKQINILDEHKEYVACAHNTYFLNVQSGKKQLFNKDAKLQFDLHIEDVIMGIYGKIHISSLVYRTNCIDYKKSYFDITKGVLDFPIIMTLAMKGSIHYIPDVMSTYRYLSSDSSWTFQNLKNKREIKMANLRDEQRIKLLEEFKILYPQYIETIENEIVRKEYMQLERSGKFIYIIKNQKYAHIFFEKNFLEKCKVLIKCVICTLQKK